MVEWPHAGPRGDRRPGRRGGGPRPARARLLAGLAEPASASALAERVDLPRQKVNYHLRILEEHGLVTEVGQRRWGGLTERVLHATAAAYVVSPGALGEAAGDPDRIADRLSARYLIALAARAVREVAGLIRRADRAGKRLPPSPSTPRSASAPRPTGPPSPATWPTP